MWNPDGDFTLHVISIEIVAVGNVTAASFFFEFLQIDDVLSLSFK